MSINCDQNTPCYIVSCRLAVKLWLLLREAHTGIADHEDSLILCSWQRHIVHKITICNHHQSGMWFWIYVKGNVYLIWLDMTCLFSHVTTAVQPIPTAIICLRSWVWMLHSLKLKNPKLINPGSQHGYSRACGRNTGGWQGLWVH